MREIRTSGSMSGEGKRSHATWPKPPRPSSTLLSGSHSNRILAHCDDGDGNRLPLSYAVGAVIAGVVADRLGISSAMWLIAALTFVSGLFVFLRMRETNAGAFS